MFTNISLARDQIYYLNVAIKEFYLMAKDITLSGIPDDEMLLEVLRLREYPTMSSTSFKVLVSKNIDKFTKTLFLNYLNSLNLFFDIIKAAIIKDKKDKTDREIEDLLRNIVTDDELGKIDEIINSKCIDTKRDYSKFLIEFILLRDTPTETVGFDNKPNSLLKDRLRQTIISLINEIEKHLTLSFNDLNTRQEMVSYLQYVTGIITILYFISVPFSKEYLSKIKDNYSTGLIPKNKKISISPEIALLSVTMDYRFKRKVLAIYDIDKPGTTSYSDHALKFYNWMSEHALKFCNWSTDIQRDLS